MFQELHVAAIKDAMGSITLTVEHTDVHNKTSLQSMIRDARLYLDRIEYYTNQLQ